ncbi:energy-coupling factor ABC transporter permease [Conexibacter stalactiti]|uniref:Energy-coupling factor ABC transporter permease n=1 Tax=Conexibacter stalactiti TaxID=1940611 RepID=A0ABU4HYW2_9ACTN|nr:energy-coupling factor ABC transporter permease [Conexibacter stalactiti]MDW5597892.1 energy-coupling factor ABC transporter permease [Conexibacter stalactiti]MEC5038534.1 energy-coupling factor ABC transporter permease [Conexibacter stalactiti]
MHIPDGYLSPEVAVATTVVSVAVLGFAARRAPSELDERRLPLLGVTAAFIFAVQMLNFPVAHGTSGHLLGAALAAALLGPWLGCLTVAAVLAVQALLFADGGIAALGANVLNMAVIGALLTGWLLARTRSLTDRSRSQMLVVVAGAAWLSVMAGAVATAVELAASGTVPLAEVLPAMLETHALIGVGEALITVAAVALVLVRPRAFVAAALAVSVALAVAVAPYASAQPDGLERVAIDHGFAGSGRLHAVQEQAPAPDYAAPGIDDPRLATAVAGAAGTLALFALVLGAGAVVRRRQPLPS